MGHADENGEAITIIERWNGTQWSVVNSPNVQGANVNTLGGVAADPDSAKNLWAVGVSNISGNLFKGLIEHCC